MDISRRRFIAGGSAAVGAAALLGSCDKKDAEEPTASTASGGEFDPTDWQSVRDQFDLDPSQSHMSAFVLASHPRVVRDAIARHRTRLDENTKGYLDENELHLDEAVSQAVATYLGASTSEVALTDSTTMGLGLVYGGLNLHPGDEFLTTTHDFYSTHEAIRLSVERQGATSRQVELFTDPSAASVDEIVSNVAGALKPETRALGITWVHSSAGMRLPVPAIAEAVAEANKNRSEDERVLLCVDGIHGFANQDVDVLDLGCDFLISGCHKWLFGPRGTGFVWGREEAWSRISPIIPSFTFSEGGPTPGATHTPGGYHSFEHRWALTDAIGFHDAIGRDRVHQRTEELASRLKAGLAELPAVELITPVDPELSAGIVCFEVDGMSPPEVVPNLASRNVIASITPYAVQYTRMGPGIVTTEDDVDKAIEAVAAI